MNPVAVCGILDLLELFHPFWALWIICYPFLWQRWSPCKMYSTNLYCWKAEISWCCPQNVFLAHNGNICTREVYSSLSLSLSLFVCVCVCVCVCERERERERRIEFRATAMRKTLWLFRCFFKLYLLSIGSSGRDFWSSTMFNNPHHVLSNQFHLMVALFRVSRERILRSGLPCLSPGDVLRRWSLTKATQAGSAPRRHWGILNSQLRVLQTDLWTTELSTWGLKIPLN